MCILRNNFIEPDYDPSSPDDSLGRSSQSSRVFFQRSDEDVKHDFNENEFMEGLCLLDKEITNSKNLRRVLPLRVIAIDGYVSLTSLGNCSKTSRLTYILDPTVVPQWKIQEKLRRATEVVADHLGYDRSWMCCQPAGHISARLIRAIWMESIDQNVIIWAGQNITVYAPLWEWMLDEKMKLIAGAFPYVERQDLTDAVDILRKVNLKYKKVTSANQLIHRHRRIQPPVRMGMYRILNQFYEQKYQKAGLVFEECQRLQEVLQESPTKS